MRDWVDVGMEHETGFRPATLTLARDSELEAEGFDVAETFVTAH